MRGALVAAARLPAFAAALVLLAWGRASTAQTPNLTAESVVAPAAVTAGGSAEVSISILSEGATSTASFAVLMSPGNYRAGATELGRFGPFPLPADGRFQQTVSVNLPAGLSGVRTFLLEVDPADQVAESNEYDNLAFVRVPTVIRTPAVLPEVEGVTLSARSAAPSETLRVSFEVSNRGTAAASLVAAVVVGRDPVATGTDRELARTTIALPASDRVPASVDVQLPADLAAGPWWVGVLLDPDRVSPAVPPAGSAAVAAEVLTVVRPELVLLTSALPDGAVRQPYSVGLEARGGDGGFGFEVDGTLPAGLSFDPQSRLIAGVPLESGTFSLTLRVRSDGRTDEAPLELRVQPLGLDLSIETSALGEAFVRRPYEALVIAGGGEPPYAWRLTEGALPSGLSLAPSGEIAGEPEALGLSEFSLTVADRLGEEREASFRILVSLLPEVLIQTSSVPAEVGLALDAPFTAKGGVRPLTWRAETAPPPGLTLAPSGRLTGVPMLAGRWPFRVSATDATNPGVSDFAYVEVVVADGGALRITSGPMAEVPRVAVYEHILTAEGGTPPYQWSLVPGDFLPGNFALVPGPERGQPENTGVIYGQTASEGLAAFTVRVRDAYGRIDEQPLVYFVDPVPVSSDGGGGGCRATFTYGQGGFLPWLLLILLLVLRRRLDPTAVR